MKKVTISIPEEKYDFFIELLESLDFAIINSEEEILISEEQKALVRNRIKTASEFKNWDEIKESFKV